MALGRLKPVCFPISLCQSKCVSVGMPASFFCEDRASGTQGTVVAANWRCHKFDMWELDFTWDMLSCSLGMLATTCCCSDPITFVRSSEEME